MSLMEYCDILDGVLVQTYEKSLLVPIRCEWCAAKVVSVAMTGDNWICPECIGKMRGETIG